MLIVTISTIRLTPVRKASGQHALQIERQIDVEADHRRPAEELATMAQRTIGLRRMPSGISGSAARARRRKNSSHSRARMQR